MYKKSTLFMALLNISLITIAMQDSSDDATPTVLTKNVMEYFINRDNSIIFCSKLTDNSFDSYAFNAEEQTIEQLQKLNMAYGLFYSPHGDTLIVKKEKKEFPFYIFDNKTKQFVRNQTTNPSYYNPGDNALLIANPDDYYVISNFDKTKPQFVYHNWDNTEEKTVPFPYSTVDEYHWNPNFQYIVINYDDKRIQCFLNTTQDKTLTPLSKPMSNITSSQWNPDGTCPYLITHNSDATLQFHTMKKEQFVTINAHIDQVDTYYWLDNTRILVKSIETGEWQLYILDQENNTLKQTTVTPLEKDYNVKQILTDHYIITKNNETEDTELYQLNTSTNQFESNNISLPKNSDSAQIYNENLFFLKNTKLCTLLLKRKQL